MSGARGAQARWAEALARWGRRHRALAVLPVLASALALALLAPALRVDPSLRRLLPAHLPSQRALEEAEARVPLASPLYVAVTSASAERTAAAVDALVQRLRGWEVVRSVTDHRDPDYFLQRRLLYAPADLLEELADAMEERLDWERCARLPGCVNLDSEPPEVPLEALRDFYREDPRIGGLLRLLGVEASELERDLADPPAGGGTGAERTAAPGRGRLCRQDGRTCVIQVLLRGEGSDVAWAERVLREGSVLVLRVLREELGERGARRVDVDLVEGSGGLRVQLRGRLRNLVASRGAIRSDLAATTLGAVALVVLVLWLQFRGWRAFVVLLGPMLVGFAVALGLLVGARVRLNLVSAATLSVLVGIGIDFGIHLVTHHGEALAEGREPARASGHVFGRLLGSLAAAAATTAIGFGALLGAEFQGFAQMGVVALVGVLSVFAAYVLVFPLLAGALGAGGGPWLRGGRRWQGFAGRGAGRGAWPLAGGLLALAAAGGLLAGQLRYETDYKKLQPSVKGRFGYARALHGTERSPVLVLADDEAQLREAVRRMRTDHPDGLDGEGPGWLLSPDLFVPEEQPRKLRAIARMRATLEELLEQADGSDRERLLRVRPWLAVEEPIGVEELPGWVRELLTERDGRFGTFAIAYARVRTTDAEQMERLAATLAEWRRTYRVRFASFAAMLGEVQASLRRDTPEVVGVALLGLLLATGLLGRSLVRALWVTAALLLASGLAAGALVLLELRPNLYNVPVLPAAFGLGVDGAIYVTWALWRGRRQQADLERLASVRRAVLGSTLTTLGAFGALLLADSPGLRTMGEMALVTLSATLLVNLLWLPAAQRLLAGAGKGDPGNARRAARNGAE